LSINEERKKILKEIKEKEHTITGKINFNALQ
jgi:hypothetical protein